MTADGSHLIFRNVTRSRLPGIPAKDGHACYVVRPLDRAEHDAEVGPMWRVEFDDGRQIDAFGEELFIP